MMEPATMMRHLTLSAAMLAAVPLGTTLAQTALSPRSVFEGTAPAATPGGQPVHVTSQTWAIPGRHGELYELPLRGFYVAHLQAGDVATTIDGQTTEREPGAFWTVKSGATMQVKVLGEFAVLETIVPTKQ
jgi:hypothetical protein